MKTIYLFLAFLFTTNLVAQERDLYKQPLNYSNTGEVILREVLHYPGKSKAELAQLSEEWFARKFDGELVQVDLQSEERNKLIGRGYFSYSFFAVMNSYSCEANYVLTISLKEERIKVEMEEIILLGETSLINIEEEVLQPKPARKVISDEAMYKRNGKARKMKRKHKERILSYWYEVLDSVDGFLNTSQEEEENW